MRTAGLERIAITKDEDRGEAEEEAEEEADAMAGILVTMRTRQPERRMAVPVVGIFWNIFIRAKVSYKCKG